MINKIAKEFHTKYLADDFTTRDRNGFACTLSMKKVIDFWKIKLEQYANYKLNKEDK